MGTAERRERERQATRQGILDAARRIAQEGGWSAVTIRKIADRVEYTSPIIYQHFKNKEAALAAILHEGFADLAAAIEREIAPETDSVRRLVGLGRAYIRFAQERPELYEIMNGMGGAALDPGLRRGEAAEVVRLVERLLGEWAASQEVSLPDLGKRTETLWALAHGLVSIALLERSETRFEQAAQTLEETALDLLSAWTSRFRST